MVGRWLLIPLLVTVLVAGLPASYPAAAEPDQPPISAVSHPGTGPLGDFMGMVVRDPHYEWNTNPAYPNDSNRAFFDTMGIHLAEAGVKWVRIEIFAEELGPLQGKVNTEKYRYFINEVAPRHGIKVLALLATPLVRQRPEEDPAFFRDPGQDPNETYGPGAYIHPENLEDELTVKVDDARIGFVNPYMRIWLENAFQVVQAFPYNQNTGAGIAAFEVLNEENRYLNGGGKGLKPEAVATLLTKFYRAFKAGYPQTTADAARANTKVILGGLHPDRCDDCVPARLNDRLYLDAIYKSKAFTDYRSSPTQGNGKPPMDGVGYHPYAAEMRSGGVSEDTAIHDLYRVPARIDAVRNVMLQNNDAATMIWVTEVGDRGAPLTVDPSGDNERRQANFMQGIYRILAQRKAFIANVFWFKYEDFAVPCDAAAVGTENWGVVRIKPNTTKCAGTSGVTYDYDNAGTVERFKEAYSAYQEIAATGFSYHYVHLPQIHQ